MIDSSAIVTKMKYKNIFVNWIQFGANMRFRLQKTAYISFRMMNRRLSIHVSNARLSMHVHQYTFINTLVRLSLTKTIVQVWRSYLLDQIKEVKAKINRIRLFYDDNHVSDLFLNNICRQISKWMTRPRCLRGTGEREREREGGMVENATYSNSLEIPIFVNMYKEERNANLDCGKKVIKTSLEQARWTFPPSLFSHK